MTEPLSAEINVTITPTSDGQISLQQRYLGMSPFVLLHLNEETEQFDIEAGGGVQDLEQVKLVVGFIAAALGLEITEPEDDGA